VHRRPLLALLAALVERWPEDRERAATIVDFVAAHPDCLLRTCRPGHVTGSAWILSPDRRHVLLTHHRKLGRWLQLGGHADGEPDLREVALREAREESGLGDFTALPGDDGRLPFDLDVHLIPAREGEPAHLHHDVRFLLIAPDDAVQPSDESHELRWVARERLADLVSEESLLRMERRTRALLGLAR
jgi:8-oxo-dGTP pyrophosphatase MutT (NUDIX family)